MTAADPGPGAPALILVNGPPASGKSAMAAVLADRLDVPLFTREAVEARLLEAESPLMRASEATARRIASAATAEVFDRAEEVLRQSRPVMIEGPFLPRQDDARLARLRREVPCRPLQLLVTAALPVLVRRAEERAMQRNQPPIGPEARRELERRLREESRALEVQPTVRVDTTAYETVDLDELEARICAWMDGQPPRGD